MAYSKDARQQLGSITPNRIVKGLKSDNWDRQFTRSARQAFVKDGRRVTVHVHPKPYVSIGLIEDILCRQIGWTEEDLIRLGFLKGKHFMRKKKDKAKNLLSNLQPTLNRKINAKKTDLSGGPFFIFRRTRASPRLLMIADMRPMQDRPNPASWLQLNPPPHQPSPALRPFDRLRAAAQGPARARAVLEPSLQQESRVGPGDDGVRRISFTRYRASPFAMTRRR